MTQLNSEARRVVALSRCADDPNAADQQRVRHALARRLGAGVSAAGVGVGLAKEAVGATALLSVGKGVVLASATIVLAFALRQSQEENSGRYARKLASTTASDEPRSAPNPIRGDIRTRALVNQPPRADIPAPEPESRAAHAVSESSNPRLAATSRANPATTLESSANPTSAKSSASFEALAGDLEDATDPLQAETAALREAQRILRSGNPGRAIVLIDEQDSTYRSGVLGQERAAARIYALCALGQATEARRRAQEFARRWPRSPMLSRVRASCDAL